jgi:hypothetical protein
MAVLKRESDVMSKTLFRFVKQVASLAQKLTDAAVMQLSHPAGKPVAGWKHAVLLYLQEHMEAEYEEIIDWAAEMDRVRRVLGLRRGEIFFRSRGFPPSVYSRTSWSSSNVMSSSRPITNAVLSIGKSLH